jgi:DNA-directed RNA polymerase specialized sigma subunit
MNSKEALVGYLKKLPEVERLVIALYVYENLSEDDVSNILLIDKSRVGEIIRNTINNLIDEVTSEDRQ